MLADVRGPVGMIGGQGQRGGESGVQVAGLGSWRFAASTGGELPHAALYLRDAVGLRVPPGPAVPPRLIGPVPDRGSLLPEVDRGAAGQQWVGWWASLLTVEAAGQDEPRTAPAARRREVERLAGPPDFVGLAEQPELQRAAVAVFPEALRWAGRTGSHQGIPHERGFPYELVRQVAEDVAFDRGVQIGAVRARAVVLDVDGEWWHLLGPGSVVCSVGAAEDPVLGHSVLRRAFESGLRA